VTDTFAVWLFFPDGSHLCEGRGLDAREAVNLACDCTRRPAALLGIVERIIIVDAGDNTTFEWRYRQGVVFPPLRPAEPPTHTQAGDGRLIVGAEKPQ
jgi:hypothetical protein